MEQISRRNFIIGAGATIAGFAAGGCANPDLQTLPAAGAEDCTISCFEINGGATVGQQAVRGEQIPIGEPPKPPQTWIPGELYTHVLVNELLNAYTFDDGPSPYNTEPILRTLAEYGIKATFFVVGVNVRAWPEILQRIVDEGHEIGNHSVYHSPYESLALANQIGPNQNIIQETVGIRPVANRAPGLTKGAAILNACRVEGMYEVHTNMGTNDWRGDPRWSANQLYNEHVKLYQNGGIWLYHDGGNERPTPSALPSMIQFDISKGARLVTSTEILNSGIPVPGRSAVAAASSADSRLAQSMTEEQTVGTTCNYDPKAELQTRLKDVSLKRAERSRIVEVLADIDAMEKVA